MVLKNPEVMKRMESLKARLTFDRLITNRDAIGQLSDAIGLGDFTVKKLIKELKDFKGKVEFKKPTKDAFIIILHDEEEEDEKKKKKKMKIEIKKDKVRLYLTKARFRDYSFETKEVSTSF